MKFLSIVRIIIIFSLLVTISLQAQKTKKGKQKQKPATKTTLVKEKPQVTEKKEKKEDIGIAVKTEEPVAIEEKPTIVENEKPTPVKEESSKVTTATEKVEVASPPAKAGEVVNPITFNQYFSNDIWFRGFSVLGNKLSQRDNMAYNSIPQAWNVVTGVAYNPTENFSIGMNVYSPTAHRANRDNDYYMQTAPGDKTDFSQKYLESAQSGNPSILINDALTRDKANPKDPTSIQMRKEKNGLKDIFDASFTYKYNTRFGKVITGAYIANNDNYNVTLGELVTGLEFPFLKALSPTYTSYYRVTSEGGGCGNGTSNHRLSISHKFFADKEFNITANLAAGYQYHTNLSDYRSGVSDITPKLQFNYGGMYFSVLDMIRPDSSIWDTSSGFGSAGVYKDTNRRDGRVEDPSKVHGLQNQLVVNSITKGVDDYSAMNSGADPNGYGREAIKAHLVQNYQQQKFVHHIFHFTVGYSLKF